MKKLNTCLITLAIGAFPAANAIAADGGVTATVGLKAWANKWSTWNETRDGGNNFLIADYILNGTPLPPIVQNIESGNTNGLIPSVSVRYQDFLAAASYFAKTKYSFTPSLGDTKRDEYDVIVGYYVLPSLAVSAGYKKVKQQFVGGDFTYSGPIVGFNGSAPLTGGFSLYGTAAVGLNFKGKAQGQGQAFDSDYRLGEVGLAYAFDAGGSGLKSVIATFGYRSQAIVSKFPGAWSGQSGRDTTEGFTLGVGAVF